MLDPSQRQLYVEALRPPPGCVLGEAIATTYGLDLTTLLGIPIALELPHLDARSLGRDGGLALLEGIRRASARLTVFCDRGRIAVPDVQHVLYAMLERVIVGVVAPAGGSLHAKLWVIRFEPADGEPGEPVMRLMVLSRNLTPDRSWDVSLVLDGRLTGRNKAINRPLADLVEGLPRWAVGSLSEQAAARAARMAEQLRRTEWELPQGFDALQFHALGIGTKARRWLPDPSDRLVVISPFVTEPALAALAETTGEAVALIARGEELDKLGADAVRSFDKTYVLHQSAETEDGEDLSSDPRDSGLRGLHAKVLIAKRGWDTHMYLGSANATSQALLAGMNVEFMAELSGKTSKVPGKGIDGLLASDGLGAMLVEYKPGAVLEVDPLAEAAERLLERAIEDIVAARLELRFERADAEHVPVLIAAAPLRLADVSSVKAWLVTTDPSAASEVLEPLQTQRAELGRCATASATGLVAFEVIAASAPLRRAFALNLSVAHMPADRDAQVVRTIVDNQDRFLAYLFALLGGLDQQTVAEDGDGLGGEGRRRGLAPHGLLEQLVRARAREPRRLDELRGLVDSLTATPEGRAVVPEAFLEVWAAVTDAGIT